jgi:hypothetical protein
VAETGNFGKASLCGRDRWWVGALGIGLLALLAAAAWMTPDPRGHGTHQQLGLFPCTFEVLFGLPCPTCGMTTAWAHLVRGQLIGAFRANVGGTLLAVAAAVGAPWLLASAVRGRWLGWRPSGNLVAIVAAAIVVITLIDWGLRLATRCPAW